MDDIDVQDHTNTQETVDKGRPEKGRAPTYKGRWAARLLLLVCLLLGSFFSLLPVGRATLRSLVILPGLLGASQPAWEGPLAEPIAHTQVVIPSSVGSVYLDVYAPTQRPGPAIGSREAILVVPGVGDERQEPQLINFSQTMARAGIVVMEMLTPTLMAYRLSASDKEAVIEAFHKLQTWPEVGADRVGMVGFSAGGSLLCLAAADPRLHNQVRFVTFFGGYYDTTSLLRTMGTRSVMVDGHLQPWKPADVPLQVFANTIASRLPQTEGQLLSDTFAPGGPEKLSSSQINHLSPASQAVYHLLAGDQPERVQENLAALPPDVQDLLAGLSPSSIIGQLDMPIYLLHDRNDQYVPYSESRAFASALAQGHHTYDFVELGVFQHVEVRADQGWLQLLGDGKNILRLLTEMSEAGS